MLYKCDRLIRQPILSNLCGQCCVAMATGISLQDSIDEFGSKGATRTKQLVAVLRRRGVKCDDRLRLIGQNRTLPANCIIKMKFVGRAMGHWILKLGDLYLDPAFGAAYGRLPNTPPGAKLSSFLELHNVL